MQFRLNVLLKYHINLAFVFISLSCFHSLWKFFAKCNKPYSGARLSSTNKLPSPFRICKSCMCLHNHLFLPGLQTLPTFISFWIGRTLCNTSARFIQFDNIAINTTFTRVPIFQALLMCKFRLVVAFRKIGPRT